MTLEADLIAVSGGWTPLIHLYCHARGKPRWDDRIAALVPGDSVAGLQVAGAAVRLEDQVGELGDREDEDQVEEQLERRDGCVRVRAGHA